MQMVAMLDWFLGRDRLDIEDGTVDCPIRAGRLDVEACSSCPYWYRTDVNASGQGIVVCRSRTMCGGDATMAPPM